MEEKVAKVRKRAKGTQRKEIWRRYKKNKPALIGLFILGVILFFIIFAPLFANYEEMAIKQGQAPKFLKPSLKGIFTKDSHILGTDLLGRDIFARILYGGRNTLTIGLFSTIVSVLIGGIIGASVAYYGGKFDNIVMRLMDVINCIPSMLLSLAIIASLGPSLINLLIGMTISSIPGYVRLVRAVVLTVVDQDYIEATHACGTSDFRIITKHIIPNAMGPIIIQAATSVAGMILLASGLSYLGLGIQPPAPEWGSMLSEAKDYMRTAPFLIVVPGVTIIVSALSITLIGDGLRDALDPKLKD